MAKHKVKMTPTPTKGKGQGKPSSSSKSSTKGETIDIKDCPLAMVEICPVKEASIPRYNSVLTRSDSDGIGMEDMDSLQQELERMLTSIMVRKLHVKEELSSLQNIDKWGKNKKGPGKRLGGKDVVDGKSKKLKLMTGKAPESSRKHVHASHGQAFDPLENEQIKRPDIVSPPVIKNQIPPKFWKFVEPYCAQIQNKDVKFLEDFLKTQEDEDDLYSVPPLGQHYMIQWAREDLESEKIKKEASEDGAAEEEENEKTDISPSGKVTQRLMQGLIEENMLAQDDRQERGNREKDVKPNQSFIDSLKVNKVSNGDGLELKVKKELEDQGFLDPADENEDQEPEDDLILYEMVRCQKQLKKTAAHNQKQIRRMLKAGREEKIRQEIRERLAEADTDVRDAYTKILEVRSRKESPSVEERETAWKAIKVRNALIKALEAI